MPNFIDVMSKLGELEKKMDTIMWYIMREERNKLDDMQILLNIMVKDIHMINMILIKGDKE